MARLTKNPQGKGAAAERVAAPDLAELDTSGPAVGPAEDVTEAPAGKAVTATGPDEAPTTAAPETAPSPPVVSRDDGHPDPAPSMDTPFITVSAHATRRRAGRQWVAGEAVTFTLAEVEGLDLEVLVADPGFTVTFTDPDDIPG